MLIFLEVLIGLLTCTLGCTLVILKTKSIHKRIHNYIQALFGIGILLLIALFVLIYTNFNNFSSFYLIAKPITIQNTCIEEKSSCIEDIICIEEEIEPPLCNLPIYSPQIEEGYDCGFPNGNIHMEAEFIGGQVAFLDYIRQNLHYPEEARNLGIETTLLVSFTIDRKGNLTNIQVLNDSTSQVLDMYDGFEKAAIEVLSQSPRWQPAKINGRTVKTRSVLPITFELLH